MNKIGHTSAGQRGKSSIILAAFIVFLVAQAAHAAVPAFVDDFTGPVLDSEWSTINPASHIGFNGSGQYVFEGVLSGSAALQRSMGGQGRFVTEVSLELDPFFLDTSGGTQSDLKFRFGGSAGTVEVILNSYHSIRVYSSELGGNIAQTSLSELLSDGDQLSLQLSFVDVGGILDVRYAINGGSWVDLASASGLTGNLDGDVSIRFFKFGSNPSDLPRMEVDRFEVRANDGPSARGDIYQTDQDTQLVVPAPGVLDNDTHPLALPISAVLVSNASFGVATLNSNGGFTYQPSAGYSGQDSFVYHADDGSNVNAAIVTIDVIPPPSPVTSPDFYQTPRDTALAVAAPGVLDNDTHPLAVPISAVVVSNASFGVVSLDSDGGFNYQPTEGYSGFDSFIYQATDGTNLSPPTAVTIDVTPPPPPVANPDSYETPHDTPLVVSAPGVLANDTHPLALPISSVLVSNASFGLVTLSTNGGFTYQPPAGYSGSDSFIYEVNDGTTTSTPVVVELMVASPPLRIVDFELLSPGSGQYRIEWNSKPDKLYTIDCTTDLSGGWQPIATNITATPPTNIHVLDRPDRSAEFFRISEEGRHGLFINEFMASSSSSGIEDPDEPGEYPDWIELYNNTTEPIDISGWYMTDNLDAPDQFRIPSGIVPALGYLLLYADDDPEQGPDHLGFKLSAGGEAIGLSADGVTFVDSMVFGAQAQDESFGRFPDGSLTWVLMTNASPDSANQTGFLGEVADTKFTVDRGFFTSPFQAAITSATTDADIYYTTDFSEPSPGNGILYTGPVTISGTTCLRAAAFKDGWKATDVDTHTYIFVDDVLTQSSNQPGLPDEWNVNNGVFPPYAVYGVDPAVVGAYPLAQLTNALQSIPSVSIVTEPDNLYHPVTGIYTHPELRDLAGERPCSVEWIQPDGSPGIGVNCGLRIQGNWARMFAKKRPFRLLFKSEYGPSELNYPVFDDDTATDTFNTIVLRSNIQGDPETQTEDLFSRRIVSRMGIPQSHGTYVHLYVNGLYWGLYNPTERPMAAFCEEYMGGEREDWDSHNGNGQGGAVDGTLASWNAMNALIDDGLDDNVSYQRIQGNNPDGTPNPAYPRYLNVGDYIDYILYNFWGSMADWPKAGDNWYGARYRPEDTTGYKWFIWDAEAAFNTGDETAVTEIPAHAHAALKLNPEYLLQFGDHTHRHLFNDGVLTPENLLEVYAQVMGEVEPHIMLDEARWSEWTAPWNGNKWISKAAFDGRVNWITNNYLPNRTATAIDQFRAAGLYPQTDAPVFRIDGTNQHGGSMTSGGMLSMTNTTSDPIYYTFDGTDPREYGTGNAVGTLFGTDIPLTQTTRVKARSLSSTTGWSALNEAVFTLDPLSPLRVTEIMYHPRPPQTGTVETNYTTSDFEFIELKNTSGSPVGLAGLAFVDGIRFDFSEANVTTLAPGEFALLVRNVEAFTTRYPGWTNLVIAGTYHGRFYRPVGSLSNSGEELRLVDGLGRGIHLFDYEDDWFPSTDGEGYSLTIIDPLASLESWDAKLGWRPSAYLDGSPGSDDSGAVPYLPGTVVINEALTHQDTDPPGDWIEIHNTSGNAIDVGNWYLSDDPENLTAFKINAGTMIPAGGYLTFTEATHFGAGVLGTNGFALSEHGEEIHLSAGDGTGLAEPAYRESVTFGAAENDVTFGRHVKQDGSADFTAMSATTMNAANAYPLVGPVVISEIMYNPTNGYFEFVELLNISGAPVQLYDPAQPGNRWKIAGLGFEFPPLTTMAAGEAIVVTEAEVSAFKNLYGLGATQQVFGASGGSLDNSGEALELMKPGNPDEIGVPYIVVDRVKYNDQAPWPPAPDGQGPSLERIVPSEYGNDVINWQTSSPVGGTPGEVSLNLAAAMELYGMPRDDDAVHFASSAAAEDAATLAGHLTSATNEALSPLMIVGFNVVATSNMALASDGVVASEGIFQLQWISEVDKTYTIAGTTNLAGLWINLATNLPATPPTNTFLLIRPAKDFEVFKVIEESEPLIAP